MPIPDPWPKELDVDGHPLLWRRYGMGYGYRVAIRGTRHDIHFIVTDLAREPFSWTAVEEYAAEFGHTPEEVWAAVVYYGEHGDELEEYIAAWHAANDEELYRHAPEEGLEVGRELSRLYERQRRLRMKHARLLYGLDALGFELGDEMPAASEGAEELTPESARRALQRYWSEVPIAEDEPFWESLKEMTRGLDPAAASQWLEDLAATRARVRALAALQGRPASMPARVEEPVPLERQAGELSSS